MRVAVVVAIGMIMRMVRVIVFVVMMMVVIGHAEACRAADEML